MERGRPCPSDSRSLATSRLLWLTRLRTLASASARPAEEEAAECGAGEVSRGTEGGARAGSVVHACPRGAASSEASVALEAVAEAPGVNIG